MRRRLTLVMAPAAIALGACGGPFEDNDARTGAGGAGGEATSSGAGLDGAGGQGGSAVPACETDLTAQLGALRVPRLSAAILEDGALRCTAVAGHADIAHDRPVTPNTLFAWASVSKTVAATAAMILYDEGKLGLDDDVGDHLPFSVRHPSCRPAPGPRKAPHVA